MYSTRHFSSPSNHLLPAAVKSENDSKSSESEDKEVKTIANVNKGSTESASYNNGGNQSESLDVKSKLGDAANKGRITSSSVSPPSSNMTANKVSLYELGIPQSYIRRPRKHRQKRSSSSHLRESRNVSGHYVDLLPPERLPIITDEPNYGDVDASAEHKTEHNSSSSLPKQKRDTGTATATSKSDRSCRSQNNRSILRQRKTAATNSSSSSTYHRKRVSATISSSGSSCCRHYYGQYCHNANQIRRKRKTRVKHAAAAADSTFEENIEDVSKVSNWISKWFDCCNSKQYQLFASCLCILIVALSCFVLPGMRIGLDEETDVVNENSELFHYIRVIKHNFNFKIPLSILIDTSEVDLPHPKIQRLLNNLDDEMQELLPRMHSSDDSSNTHSWLKKMRQFLIRTQQSYRHSKQSMTQQQQQHPTNITQDTQMGKVLLLHSGSSQFPNRVGLSSSSSDEKDLVDSDGIISPTSFYSLLTAWNNWDIDGVFKSQPAFYPSPPYLPAFEPDINFVTPAEKVRLSAFHYEIALVPSSKDKNKFLIDQMMKMFKICSRFSTDGLKVFPSGNTLFAWSQFYYFARMMAATLLFGVSLVLPSLLYVLLRNSRLSAILVVCNVGHVITVIAVCVLCKVNFSPLCLCLLIYLFSLYLSFFSSTLTYPFCCSHPNKSISFNLFSNVSQFYVRMLIVCSTTVLSHILIAIPLLFSYYALFTRSIFVVCVVSSLVFWFSFVLILPAAASHLAKHCRKCFHSQCRQKEPKTNSSQVSSYSTSPPQVSISDQPWHWLPYSTSWHGSAVSRNPLAAGGYPTLNQSTSFPFGTGSYKQYPPPDVSNIPPSDSRQLLSKFGAVFSGHGTLTRREKLRLQRSYVKNQQFLAMAVTGISSSRTSISNTSKTTSPMPQPNQLCRSHSSSSNQGNFSSSTSQPILLSNSLTCNNIAGKQHVTAAVAKLPSTCSTERKHFIYCAMEAGNEEHDCCMGMGNHRHPHPGKHYPQLRQEDDAATTTSSTSFYPFSMTDAESDFLLMRSPSQTMPLPPNDEESALCCTDNDEAAAY